MQKAKWNPERRDPIQSKGEKSFVERVLRPEGKFPVQQVTG
jgi:hypothetical protein